MLQTAANHGTLSVVEALMRADGIDVNAKHAVRAAATRAVCMRRWQGQRRRAHSSVCSCRCVVTREVSADARMSPGARGAAAAVSFLCNAVNALVLQARRGAGLWDGRAAPSCAQWTLTRRDSADASLGDRCECEGQCARARVHCSVRSLAHENSRARTRNGHLRGRGCVCRPGRRRLI